MTWQVVAGATPENLVPVASGPRQGFETTIDFSTDLPYVAVRALDSSGAVLGESLAI